MDKPPIMKDDDCTEDDEDTLRIEVLDEVGFDLPVKSPFARGSDPRVATCRGRLQNRRCQLNQEINKELRLRAGAENLFKATTNRKLKETVALELSFVNSNLQLLKEQLAELNSSVELYQNDSKDSLMPMVPLGLKETKDVDFREPFKDFILEHYSEDATTYEDAISDFMDMRQAMRTPVRSAAGVALLFRYYNQLYYIERRFFPPDRSLGIYFEWFDSLTGVPSCQRTVAFEKACVLFNMAAIYTQIGAKQERRDCDGLDGSVDALLRAAGTLRYIHENFTNAPSVDLSADMLDTLVNLMMAQARECLFEKLQIQARQACAEKERELCDDLELCLDLCQESSQVSQCYSLLYQKMQLDHVFHYVPYSWVSLVHVKTEFYKGLAHHHCATGLLNASSTKSATERLSQLHSPWTEWNGSKDRNGDGRNLNGPYFPYKDDDRVALGKAHLGEALSLYEEAMRLQRMCRELKAKDCLYRVLREHQDRAFRESNFLEESPDFLELIEAPAIQPSTKFQLSLTSPDFAQHRVDDLFKSLGPVAIFSAKRHWSAPRLIHLQKSSKNGHKLRRKESDAKKDRSRSANKQFTTENGDILRNGLRALRSVPSFEKRDRSEDNSAYYLHKDVLKNDEKYSNEKSDSLSDVRKKIPIAKATPITKQNGVYINGYTNTVKTPDYRKPIERTNGRLNGSNGLNAYSDKIMIKSRSKNDLSTNGKSHDILIMKNGHPIRNGAIKNGDLLRRVSSDFNISPSSVILAEKNQEGYGFSVRGDAPVIIAGVETNSLADMGGMKEGDFIVAIGDKDVKWWPHDEVVSLIKASGDSLSLKLVTPMDRNYLKQQSSPVHNPTPHKDTTTGSNPGSVSAASSSSGGSTGARNGATRTSARRAPATNWNPFKRHNNSRDSSSNRGSHSSNVIFR